VFINGQDTGLRQTVVLGPGVDSRLSYGHKYHNFFASNDKLSDLIIPELEDDEGVPDIGDISC
jgi:hypothetical protein